MAVATYHDVGTILRREITDTTEQDQIEWWLNGIELLIATRLGPVDGLNQDAVKYVEAEAVAAKVRRTAGSPSDEASITVSVDDGSVTRRWDHSSTVGLEDITDEWWELLAPKRESVAFSTRPGYSPDCPTWPVRTRFHVR